MGYIEVTADGSAYHPIDDPPPRAARRRRRGDDGRRAARRRTSPSRIAPPGPAAAARPPLAWSGEQTHPAARRRRLRRRLSQPRLGDRRRAPARAVLRRLHDHLGQHDRHRPRGAVGRLLDRRARRGPRRHARRACTGSCSSRRCCSRSCRSSRGPFLGSRGRRAGLGRRPARSSARCSRCSCSSPTPVLVLGMVVALRDPPRAAPDRRRGRDGRAPLRDLHARVAGGDVPQRAPAHPARRDAADVPGLRARARDRRASLGVARARWAVVPAAVARRARAARRDREGGERRRPRDRRRRHRVPVRAGHRVARRRAAPRAQRGPGDPLAHPPRHLPHRRATGTT